ncbi:MAG: SPFH domain-containing protein [Candidatus Omnitrophota bacterium]
MNKENRVEFQDGNTVIKRVIDLFLKNPNLQAGSFVFIVVLIFFFLVWIWLFCRIELQKGEMAVLIKNTGKALPSGEIIATSSSTKGIQLDVLSEGRYFKNPYVWAWRVHKLTDIPAGKLGIKMRLFGDDLPAGKIIASDGYKGIMAEVLRPGRYRINPYAYRVKIFDAVNIRPGHVGIVTSLVGDDILSGKPESVNSFLVKENEKGVQPRVLDPGTYYLNPYVYSVTEVDLRSQRFQISGSEAIIFFSMDGFEITVEGTIEWAIDREKVAWVTHRIGDLEDIQKKIIMPHVRGFMRIEGSKKPAVEYILGETRKQFQDNLFVHLQKQCSQRGISIKSTLIRNIQPPDEIATIKRDREVAVQNRNKYGQQMEEARSKAELVKQEMLAEQKKEKVAQETKKIKAVIEADKDKAVALTEASKRGEVAELQNEAADFEVEAVISRGKASRDVIDFNNKAEAEVLKKQAEAFRGGDNLARYQYIKKISSRINTILGDEDGPLGSLLGTITENKSK